METKTLLFVALFMAAVFSGATVLDDATFESTVDGTKYALVEFYAPWCGHCKNLAPVYEELGDAFAHAADKVVIAKVDATENEALAQRFEVRGYPTLLFFAPGQDEPEKYDGGRELADLAEFVGGKAGVRAKIAVKKSDVVVGTPQNFDNLLADDKVTFVEFYAPWCGHCKKLAPTWEDLARVFRSEPRVQIVKVDADAHGGLKDRFGVSGFPTLKCFGCKEEDYAGGRDLESLVDFVNEQAGTQRLSSGFLDDFAGRAAELDDLAAEFVAKPATELVEKVKDTAADVAGDDTFSRKMYAGYMKKILANGIDYVATEKARLRRMLEGTSLTDEKKDQFKIRYNILNAFQEDSE